MYEPKLNVNSPDQMALLREVVELLRYRAAQEEAVATIQKRVKDQARFEARAEILTQTANELHKQTL